MRSSDWSSDVCSSDLSRSGGPTRRALRMARCIDHGIGRSTAYKDSFIFDLLLKAGIDTERCSSRRHRLGGFHFGLQTQETIVATAPAADVKDYVIADIEIGRAHV